MKKTSILIILLTVFSVFSFVYAKEDGNSQGPGPGQDEVVTQGQAQPETTMSPSPSTGNQIQNQNIINTQNQGEESQLQINTEEKESFGENKDVQGMPKDPTPRSQTARESMSAVARAVEELLTTQGASGGIGQQVRQVALDQKQAQDELGVELDKVDRRGILAKSLFGPDFTALKNMKKQMEQNELRIQQLERLQNQLIDEDESAMVQEMIKSLTEQNISLEDRIALEDKTVSLLGWLFRLFAR